MTTPPQDSTAEERPRRARHEPEAPTAPVALDDKEQMLSDLLPEVFADYDVEVGAILDEVTMNVKPVGHLLDDGPTCLTTTSTALES